MSSGGWFEYVVLKERHCLEEKGRFDGSNWPMRLAPRQKTAGSVHNPLRVWSVKITAEYGLQHAPHVRIPTFLKRRALSARHVETSGEY